MLGEASRKLSDLLQAIAQARELPIPSDEIVERRVRIGRARVGRHENDRAFATLRLLAEARELDVPADRAREAVEAGAAVQPGDPRLESAEMREQQRRVALVVG